jgi:MFS family permease
MEPTMSADSPSSQPQSIRMVVVASLIGTSLEWYDFFLYSSAAALVFNKLFFPEADPLTGTLLAFATSATGFIAFYTFALFILVYVTDRLDLPRSTALNAVLIGSAFQLFLIPWFGHLSDRHGRRPVYLAGAAGAAIWVLAFFPLLDTRSTLLIVVAAVGGLLITIVSVWLAPETARIDLHDERADERRIVQDPRRLRPT